MTTARAEIFMESPHFRDVADSVLGRCSMCHTAEPFYEGIHEAPKNVHLDNDLAVAMHAREIAIQAGYSTAMPPANVSFMEPEERALIVQWYRESVAKAGSIL